MGACKRCQITEQQCIPRGRKKRKPALSQEELEEKSFDQDRQIRQLLQQLQRSQAESRYNVWVRNAPSYPDWFEGTLQSPAELANMEHFTALPSISSPPTIVKYCALYPDEVIDLFSLYFETINPSFSILDPEYHTPAKLIWSHPFLFTVGECLFVSLVFWLLLRVNLVCALASRHYSKRNIYSLAMKFARDAAGQALISPTKNVETCQAYLLLSVYPVPHRRLAEDRSWMLMGVAFSLARELGLHQDPPSSLDEREKLNRTRTWLNCFCVDGSYSTQSAKIPMISRDDYVARNSRDWYRSSPLNLTIDAHLCWYVHMITTMLDYRADLHVLRKEGESFDIVSKAVAYDLQLCLTCEEWTAKLGTHPDRQTFIFQYRADSSSMIAAYMRLAVLSQAFQHGSRSEASSASYVSHEVMVQRLYPTGRLRYALESQFLFAAFAAAFLLNLLSPEFLAVFDETVQEYNIALIRELIEVLGSSICAVDGQHSPALYSRFLSSLLGKYESRRNAWKRRHVPEVTLEFNMQRFLGLASVDGGMPESAQAQRSAIQEYLALQAHEGA
ncbi:hypothetical protein BV22DRAFT_552895 [Leucogyrophana mollusca]|uniref:Uncharacterized protein n=1 Tax=Leucogyrophana mollusca TaxID=85980 RepID=A0ACB8BF36_9AGAM|nr:hypothetical protein BV22DRAFT_552895 [Leucogyrophana mollusca]